MRLLPLSEVTGKRKDTSDMKVSAVEMMKRYAAFTASSWIIRVLSTKHQTKHDLGRQLHCTEQELDSLFWPCSLYQSVEFVRNIED